MDENVIEISKEEFNSMAQTIASLRAENEELKKSIDSARKDMTDLKNTIENLQEQIRCIIDNVDTSFISFDDDDVDEPLIEENSNAAPGSA